MAQEYVLDQKDQASSSRKLSWLIPTAVVIAIVSLVAAWQFIENGEPAPVRMYEIYLPSQFIEANGPVTNRIQPQSKRRGDGAALAQVEVPLTIEAFRNQNFDQTTIWVDQNSGTVRYYGEFAGSGKIYIASHFIENPKTRYQTIERLFFRQGNHIEVYDIKTKRPLIALGFCAAVTLLFIITFVTGVNQTQNRKQKAVHEDGTT